jgi:hypothetical protein
MPSDLAGEAPSTHLLINVVQKIFGPEAIQDTFDRRLVTKHCYGNAQF